MVFLLTLLFISVEGTKTYTYSVVNSYPHSKDDFLQGFFLEDSGTYIESTGLYGKSKLMRKRLDDNSSILEITLDKKYFGEGVVQLNGKLYQLTWKEHTMFVYDAETFLLQDTVSLPSDIKEGWGICTDDSVLYITEGSNKIFIMDPSDYKIIKTLYIKEDGKAVSKLNELEYIDGQIWSNIFYSHKVAIIDIDKEQVVGWIDFTGLEKPSDYKSWWGGDVLNGIAFYDNRYFISGKRWASIYEVKIVET